MSLLLLVLDLSQFSSIRNWSEIQKLEIPPFGLCSYLGLEWVRYAEFGTNISNKMLLKPAKCQGYSTVSELLKENQQRGRIKLLFPTKIRFKCICRRLFSIIKKFCLYLPLKFLLIFLLIFFPIFFPKCQSLEWTEYLINFYVLHFNW